MTAPARTRPTSVETRYTRSLDKRVLKYIRDHDVIRPGESLLVAVSGGPDSTAMLLLIARIAPILGLQLSVAHYDHMLRDSADHAADRGFVEALSATLGLEVTSGRGDVPARVRKQKESIEDAARKIRFEFFAGEARRRDATAVAVGHTADDRAETVLLHLIRGTGLDGLAAMPPRSSWPFGEGPDIARPLLDLTREETERYCRESAVEPRVDPTNALPAATRNRVRHQLLPLLRDFNPRIERALIRLAESSSRDTDYLDLAADAEWRRIVQQDETAIRFSRSELAALHPAIAARLLRRAAVELGGSTEASQVDELLAALNRGRTSVSLPGSITASITSTRVTLSREARRPPIGIVESPLPVGGSTHAGEWLIEAEVIEGNTLPPQADRHEVWLDADVIAGPLIVRSRRPGDRLRPLGLGGSKKVQDILVDAGVPREERNNVPIVQDSEGIVWIAGHCLDERAAVGPGTQRIVGLRVSPRVVDARQTDVLQWSAYKEDL